MTLKLKHKRKGYLLYLGHAIVCTTGEIYKYEILEGYKTKYGFVSVDGKVYELRKMSRILQPTYFFTDIKNAEDFVFPILYQRINTALYAKQHACYPYVKDSFAKNKNAWDVVNPRIK